LERIPSGALFLFEHDEKPKAIIVTSKYAPVQQPIEVERPLITAILRLAGIGAFGATQAFDVKSWPVEAMLEFGLCQIVVKLLLNLLMLILVINGARKY
jgi:hypothetical protein